MNVPERVKGDGDYFTPISLCSILELYIILLWSYYLYSHLSSWDIWYSSWIGLVYYHRLVIRGIHYH